MVKGMGIKLYMVIPVAFFVAVGAVVFGYFVSEWVFLSLLLSPVLLLCLKLLFKRKIAALAVCVVWFFIFSFHSMDKGFDKGALKDFENKDAVVYLQIKGLDSKNEYLSTYIAEVSGISDDGKLIYANEKCELKVDAEESTFSYGDFIKAEADVSKISGIKNSGETDFSLFKKAKGITYSLNASKAKKLSSFDKISDLEDLSYCLRSYIKKVCCDMLGEKSAALVMGILISDKSLLDAETWEILESAGIMHICVASGMHVNCIMSAVAFLLAGVGVRRKYFLAFSLPLILFYAFLNNWSSPIIRAGIGAALFCVSFGAKRDYDPFIALCFSGLVILMFSPLKLFDAGFLLSFSAVLALIFLKDDLEGILSKERKTRRRRESIFFKRIIYYIKTTVLASTAVSLIVVPSCAYLFEYISPYSIVTNLIVSWVLPYLFFSASAMVILWFVPILKEVFAFFTDIAARFILKVSEAVYHTPFSKIEAFVPFGVFVIIIFLILFLHNVKKKKIINRIGEVLSLSVLGVLLLGQVVSFVAGINTVKVRFVNIGEGDGCIIKLADGTGIVVDAGGSEFSSEDRTFTPYIRRMGITKIRSVFVSHFDADHAKNILYVLDNFEVFNVILPLKESESKYKRLIENKAKEQGSDIVYITSGDRFNIAENIEVTVFSPKREIYGIENDDSVVMKLDIDGTSILFLGDAGSEIQDVLAALYKDKLKSDIVKISHHGDYNSYSELLMHYADPKFAVISCGEKKRYSHPNDEVIKALEKENIITYITNEDKDIKFNIDLKDSISEKYYERSEKNGKSR